MSIEKMQNEVEEIKHRIEENISIAEKKLLTIKDNLLQPAKMWIDDQVRDQIKKYSKSVADMASSDLSRFKANVNEFKDRLPTLFDSEFSDPNRYPHNEIIDNEEDSYSSTHYNFVDDVFRKVVSNLGEIFNIFGLMERSGAHYSTWQTLGQNKFRYSINLGLDNFSEINSGDYHNDCIEIKNLKRSLLKKQRLLNEAIAKEKWEKA